MKDSLIALLQECGFKENKIAVDDENLHDEEYLIKFDGNYHYVSFCNKGGYTTFKFYANGKYAPSI